jgi:hypothetical protein
MQICSTRPRFVASQPLRQYYATAPGFAELCDAYETACDAALYSSKSTAPIGPERAAEYRALMTATVQDILHKLS